jgi:EpsI family protein
MASDAEGVGVTAQAAGDKAGFSGKLAGAVVLGGLLLLYAPVVAGMVAAWWRNPASSHGFLVAPLAAYLAWSKRGRVSALARAWTWGMLPLAFGLLLYPAGVLTQIEFLPEVSFMIALGGMMLLVLGPAASRELAFPYAFLYFMVPWPDTLVEWLSFPMQLFSAKYAAMAAGLAGMAVSRDGVDIHVSSYTFSVGAPCSGMKSLVALLALSSLLAYLLQGARWRRWLLFAAGLPLALLANVGRIVVILCIANTFGSKAAEGFLHGFSGVLVFASAAGGLMLAGRGLGLQRPGPPAGLGPQEEGIVSPGRVRSPAWWHAVPALALMAAAYWLVALLRPAPASQGPVVTDLSALPMAVSGWTATDTGPLDRQSQEMLHPDAYLGRVYTRADGYPIDVTVVFGHAKETFHSPGFCLLGGGWNIIRKGRRTMTLGAGNARVEANQFSLQRREERSVVLYWYASKEETTPSWLQLQYRLLRNRLTGRSPAGALVRVTAPVGESDEKAAAAGEELIGKLYPDLTRLMGL